MTAEPHGPVAEGVCSLEVRWIFPGQLETAVARWFSRFPATTESREDTYLLDLQLRGLSVKVRAGRALEVKVYCGSPGILQVPGRARGRLEAWQKWSFRCSPLRQDSADPAGWQPVRKRRRISRFSLASGPAAACVPAPGSAASEGRSLTADPGPVPPGRSRHFTAAPRGPREWSARMTVVPTARTTSWGLSRTSAPDGLWS
jgi:hypothetical protein